MADLLGSAGSSGMAVRSADVLMASPQALGLLTECRHLSLGGISLSVLYPGGRCWYPGGCEPPSPQSSSVCLAVSRSARPLRLQIL